MILKGLPEKGIIHCQRMGVGGGWVRGGGDIYEIPHKGVIVLISVLILLA